MTYVFPIQLAEFVFSKLSASETKGKLRTLLYEFEFDADAGVGRYVPRIS